MFGLVQIESFRMRLGTLRLLGFWFLRGVQQFRQPLDFLLLEAPVSTWQDKRMGDTFIVPLAQRVRLLFPQGRRLRNRA